MSHPKPKPIWLDHVSPGKPGCFFYTTEEELNAIALPFLAEGLLHSRDRSLWILPPDWDFERAKAALSEHWETDPLPFLKNRRLILLPWEKWYGTELSIHLMLKRAEQMLQETKLLGMEHLRVLTHSPHRHSNYWKDFFLLEELLPKRFKSKPLLSLCAYSLIDCPAGAIPSIALNHSLCLIHRGSEWEWLENSPRL